MGNPGLSLRLQRLGVSTLWVLLTLPVLVLLTLYAVEAGRIHLARQQLVTSLESAALAALKKCVSGETDSTFAARECGVDFAASNLVAGQSPALDLNWDASIIPNENADCEGDLVFGMLGEVETPIELNTQYLGGFGRKTGPNAVAMLTQSQSDWVTVTLCARSYTDMVVVGTLNYGPTAPPMVVRVRNVGANSFEFVAQNVNDGSFESGYPVYFIVVEAGVYTDAVEGGTMEAVLYNSTVTDRKSSWNGENRGYLNTYTNPVVVGQVMSYNDPDWSEFWSHNGNHRFPADPGGLYTGKQVGEDTDTIRADETVGYIVFEEGVGALEGLPFYAGETTRSVRSIDNSPPYTYTLPSPRAWAYAVLNTSGEAGGDGATSHLHGNDPIDPGAINVSLDEDQLRDAERSHIAEVVHYVAFSGPCAVHARHEMEVPWYFNSLLGCVLANPTVAGSATAWYDSAEDCAKLLCVDTIVCP